MGHLLFNLTQICHFSAENGIRQISLAGKFPDLAKKLHLHEMVIIHSPIPSLPHNLFHLPRTKYNIGKALDISSGALHLIIS